MGWTSDGGYNYFSETNVAADWSFHEEKGDRGLFVYPAIWWNPDEDLNQLQECYLALSREQKATYKQLVIDHDVQSVFDVPEQHAELILKAKGVE